jgi:hypothetical protein
MSENLTKKDDKARIRKINRIVVIATLVFLTALIAHLYIAFGNWNFITGLISTNPIPWIMMVFLSAIAYFFYATYMYFRKHL